MGKRRCLRAITAAAAASLALAACGGGGAPQGPSGLDPANRVPSSAILYVTLTVKPQGSVKSDLTSAIDALAGKGAAKRLDARLQRSLSGTLKQVQGWAGQHIGMALTGLPSDLSSQSGLQTLVDDVLFVAPTNDPAAARRFITDKFNGADETGRVVGHYAIFGGQNAVGKALATSSTTSLAAAPSFAADMSQLGSGELLTFYVSLHQFVQALVPLMGAQAQGQLSQTQLNTALAQAPPGSSAAYGLSTTANQFRLDLITHGTRSGGGSSSAPPADVASLPSGSWLAVALSGALANRTAMHSLTATLPQAIARLQAAGATAGQVPSGPLRFLEQDLLPALGPITLSVSGSSMAQLRAGLVLAPLDPAAGGRLAAAVRRLVRGLPISATTSGGHVLVTYGYRSIAQLLHPSAQLAGDPAFKRALAQLPSGARASVYLNFGPIALLSALDHSAGDASELRVLHRLDYLIAGGTHSHFRVVLATK